VPVRIKLRRLWWWHGPAAIFALCQHVAADEVKVYTGQAGEEPVTARLFWKPDDTVHGTLLFHADQLDAASPESLWVLSGSNERSGHLELTAVEKGAAVALIQLNKWIRDSKIYWSGVCLFSNGLSKNIEVSRAIEEADRRVIASVYSGKVGLSEANLELLWREDKTVSGRLFVAPPRGGAGEYEVSGSNFQEGRLSLTLSAFGQVLGSVDLSKKVVNRKVHWQGAVIFSNGESDSMSVIKSPNQPVDPATSNLDPQG